MQEENGYLVLGCNGRIEDGFTQCPSVENHILEIPTGDVSSLFLSEEIWDYLEVVGLFKKRLINVNAVKNLIFHMQDKFDQRTKKLWSQQEFGSIERFIHMHKQCGLYAKLSSEPPSMIATEQKSFFIKANKEQYIQAEPQIGTGIRGRR